MAAQDAEGRASCLLGQRGNPKAPQCHPAPTDISPLTPASLPAYPPYRAPARILPHPGPNAEGSATGSSTMSQIWTGYNDVTGISYGNAKTRALCVSPLTTAKLTRSCADLYPGAIKYTQLTTDIALEVNERCKQLALKHHKCDKMRTPKARDVGCHAKTSVTPRRGSPCGCPRACICLLGQRAGQEQLLCSQRTRTALLPVRPPDGAKLSHGILSFSYLLRVRMGQMGLKADTKECVLATTDVPFKRETAMILAIPWHRAAQKRD